MQLSPTIFKAYDVRGVVPVEQVLDPVREVEVARDDPDLESDPGAFLELARVAFDDTGQLPPPQEPRER